MKVVVLDLDNTLIHSVERTASASILRHVASDSLGMPMLCPVATVAGSLLVFFRPYLIPFLLQLRAHTDVLVVWSAGQATYVQDVINRVILPFLPTHTGIFFDAIFTRDDCSKSLTEFGNMKDLRYIQHHVYGAKHATDITLIDDCLQYNAQVVGRVVNVPAFYSSIKSLASDETLRLCGNDIFAGSSLSDKRCSHNQTKFSGRFHPTK